MKGLVYRQPWATLTARGLKPIEIRSYRTQLQVPHLIVAGKTPDMRTFALAGYAALEAGWDELERGEAIAITKIYKIVPMTPAHETLSFVPYRPGLFAWFHSQVRPITSFPVRGMPGFFEVKCPHPNVVEIKAPRLRNSCDVCGR